MLRVAHFTAGAVLSARLVENDRDRFELIARIHERVAGAILAYCLMDTHVHVVAEGETSRVAAALGLALRGYTRSVNRRRGVRGPLLRGPVAAVSAPSAFEVGRMIRYVHRNPTDTHPPIVETDVAYPWSSARAYAGLSRTGFPATARARTLLGSDARRFLPKGFPLADLEPSSVPSARPETLLVAAAQTFGVLAEDVLRDARAVAVRRARSTFVALGRLESYRGPQLAGTLGLTRQRVSQLAAEADLEAVRVARTLVRTPFLRARLGGSGLDAVERMEASRA